MTLKKAIATAPGQDTKHVDLTQDEFVARQAEEAAYLAAKPMEDWKAEMEASDAELPRWGEDIIDAMPQAQRDSLSPETMAKYNAKKEKRGNKPA